MIYKKNKSDLQTKFTEDNAKDDRKQKEVRVKLMIQKTPSLVKVCLKWHKSVSKL